MSGSSNPKTRTVVSAFLSINRDVILASIAFFSLFVERLFEWRAHVADNEAAQEAYLALLAAFLRAVQ